MNQKKQAIFSLLGSSKLEKAWFRDCQIKSESSFKKWIFDKPSAKQYFRTCSKSEFLSRSGCDASHGREHSSSHRRRLQRRRQLHQLRRSALGLVAPVQEVEPVVAAGQGARPHRDSVALGVRVVPARPRDGQEQRVLRVHEAAHRSFQDASVRQLSRDPRSGLQLRQDLVRHVDQALGLYREVLVQKGNQEPQQYRLC